MNQEDFDFRCYLCSGREYKIRPGKVRDKPELFPLECLGCGLVSLSSFDHIGDGFYENSQMHGELCSNELAFQGINDDDKRRFNALKNIIENKTVLDFGCGSGGFLVQASTVASCVWGVEPEIRMQKFLQSKGVKVFSSVDELAKDDKFDYITLFHVLEHIPDPISLLKKLRLHLNREGVLVVEVPSADDALLTLYENKEFSEFTYWSCHLFLYTPSTLKTLTMKAGYVVDEVQQFQRYPLANHLYWLAKGNPRGQEYWTIFNEDRLVQEYNDILAKNGKCDTLIAFLR